MSKSVKIIIATHKQYKMPKDEMYVPVHVGAEGKNDLGYTKDNSGENISSLNPSFCELTGLYWAWKNLNADYIGLAHYRRHFSLKKKNDKWDSILTYKQIEPYLSQIRVFVPNKRKYYIETLYSHYEHTHYIEQLDVTKDIITEKYPDYVDAYNQVMNQRYGYMFNMMIMEKELVDKYCTWLFDILFELKNRLNMPELSSFQGRFYGRVSELIFNVWLTHQIQNGRIKQSQIKELDCIHMENINWWKKGLAFLKAKFFGKRYEGSF